MNFNVSNIQSDMMSRFSQNTISPQDVRNNILSNMQSKIKFSVDLLNSNDIPVEKINVPNDSTSFEEVLESYKLAGEVKVDNTATVKKETIDTAIPERIDNAIATASEKYDVDASLIKAIIKQESNFKHDTVSTAGAQGLMQLMPKTAEVVGVTDPFDIEQNVDGGTQYIKKMLDRYDGDMEMALAAYNAGPGNVSKYGGVPPFKETQNYIPKVLNYRENYLLNQYSNASSKLK